MVKTVISAKNTQVVIEENQAMIAKIPNWHNVNAGVIRVDIVIEHDGYAIST